MRRPGGLTGKSVGVEGIAGSQADVLLRITLRDGRRLRHVLEAESPSFRIDADGSHTGVFKDYAALGVEHILLGWDHLLGFAGALAEVGLPTAEIPLALFSFNVGIELDQLAFVSAVLLVTAALRRVPVAWPRWARAVPAYGIARWPLSGFCRERSR